MAASNTASIIERFREAARARGIDPVNGATVYQAANVQADLERARKNGNGKWWLSTNTNDWKNDYWAENEERPVEVETFLKIAHELFVSNPPSKQIIIDTPYINEGLRAQGLADLPLKELHELQKTLQTQKRERVKWVPGAGGVPQRVSVGVFA